MCNGIINVNSNQSSSKSNKCASPEIYYLYWILGEANVYLYSAGTGGSLSNSAINSGLNYAAQNSFIGIVNMSFGSGPAPDTGTIVVPSIYRAVAAAGKLMVVSAGNDGNSYGPSEPSVYSEQLDGSMLTSIALTSSNNITSYSQRCGRAKNWCVGTRSGTSSAGGQDAGTSFSAPHLSG